MIRRIATALWLVFASTSHSADTDRVLSTAIGPGEPYETVCTTEGLAGLGWDEARQEFVHAPVSFRYTITKLDLTSERAAGSAEARVCEMTRRDLRDAGFAPSGATLHTANACYRFVRELVEVAGEPQPGRSDSVGSCQETYVLDAHGFELTLVDCTSAASAATAVVFHPDREIVRSDPVWGPQIFIGRRELLPTSISVERGTCQRRSHRPSARGTVP